MHLSFIYLCKVLSRLNSEKPIAEDRKSYRCAILIVEEQHTLSAFGWQLCWPGVWERNWKNEAERCLLQAVIAAKFMKAHCIPRRFVVAVTYVAEGRLTTLLWDQFAGKTFFVNLWFSHHSTTADHWPCVSPMASFKSCERQRVCRIMRKLGKSGSTTCVDESFISEDKMKRLQFLNSVLMKCGHSLHKLQLSGLFENKIVPEDNPPGFQKLFG